MSKQMNGDYIASGRQVRRSPKKTETGITMGFIVCTLHAGMPDEVALEIAEALNLHKQENPEAH